MLDEDFNPDVVFNQFLNGFSKLLNFHAPLKHLTRKKIWLKTKLWINNGILKSIKKKMLCLSNAAKKRPDFD